jgi:uncharacterized tellurite resistance protein B-like protein
MLKAILDFFDQKLSAGTAASDEDHAIRLATAALLVELVKMDGGMDQPERDAILRAVRDKFALAPGEADELLRLAEEEVRQASDYYQFTSLLNRHFSAGQKVRVIEAMWAVAYADATLSAWEQHLVRKVADLLYVPHADYIHAKLKAREAAGAS